MLGTLACDELQNLCQSCTTKWWASDFAANTCEIGFDLSPLALRQMCKDEARAQEAAFVGKLSGAFQSDPDCCGMRSVTSAVFAATT